MLRINHCCFLLIAILLLSGLNSMQGQGLSFCHLTVEQGLSQNSVLCIAQDSRGFMWFGTRYGLNRFDGAHVVVYKNNPGGNRSLSDNYINVLFVDAQKKLWAGTEAGLNKLDAEKDVFEQIDLPDGIHKKPTINAIAEEKNGRLWVGSTKGLYFLQRSSANRFVPAREAGKLESFQAGNVMRLFTDSRNNLWVSANRKLYRISNAGGQYVEKSFTSIANDPASLSDPDVQCITEDRQGRIWVGTIKGLNCFDPATEKFTRFFYTGSADGLINDNVRRLMIDQTGKLWIGTQEGISIMNPATQQFESYTVDASEENSLSQNSVHSLFEDANGSVWVGTFFGGANVTHRFNTPFTAWRHQHQKPGISNNVVSSIVADDHDNLWIGTEGGGLNFYNRATDQFTIFKNIPIMPGSLSSNLVKKVFVDKDKNVWVGTHGGGLNLYDAGRRQFKHFLYDENRRHYEVVALLEDSRQQFWVGSHAGLQVFHRHQTTLSPAGNEKALKELDHKNISALIEDQKQRIWIGALEGLYIFDQATQTLKHVPVNNNEAPNVNCIFEDSRGNIWLGLYNEGLALYNEKENIFTIYTTRNGLPNDNVLGMLEDGSRQLWISTSNGLARFDVERKTFQTYTTSDGLAGNEFNYNAFYKDRHGEMFFGGIKGLTRFFPDRIEPNTQNAALVFTGLKVFNTPVNVNDAHKILQTDISFTNQLTLAAGQNTFTLEFALLNFIRSDKNKYAYKLDGVHKDWTVINTPAATFTNLPPGSYTLQIKGANNDGVWTGPVTLQINVLPPFWKTGWAYLLYAMLAAAIVFFVTRFFYLRALLARDKELHEIKLNFFTNVSHEIRTHLTLIMAPIEKMQKENAHNNVLLYHLNSTCNNVNRLLKLVTELMDFRKAESNHLKLHIAKHKLVDFLNNIYSSFEDLSQAQQIRLGFIYDTPVELYFDKEQLEKVIYNLLTNAFKFTPAGGTITLQVENKKEKVLIHVTDNGKGIAQQHLDKLFNNYFQVNDHNSQNTGYGIGLALCKTIVELHKGALAVESRVESNEKESFTCFTITLLKGYRHFEGMELAEDGADQQKTTINPPQLPVALPATPAADIKEEHYHILITEDNDEVRELIKDSLQHYQVTECINGEKGWQAATEQIPDLIISDVMMPEMDGFALCHALKTDERTSHIPVILLTAKSSQSDHVSGLSTGADLYLTKPFSTQVLELSVRNLLAAREKMRQKFSKEFVLAPQNNIINTVDEQFLARFIQVIEDYMTHSDFGVELLSEKMTMSQSVLYKKVKALTGLSVNDFAKTIRLKKAAQLLKQKQYTVFEVSVMTGFNDRKYFSKEFKKQFGKTPTEFIDGSITYPNH